MPHFKTHAAPKPVRIVSVKQDGDDGVIVIFSDGTSAGYLAEELLELRPMREHNPN
jgi:hypothetical protein